MAISELYSGTAAITTTEWSLTNNSSTIATQATDAAIQVRLDVGDMVAGDQLQVRVYEKCRSGDTQRIAFEHVLSGVQSTPLFYSPCLLVLHGWDVTLDTLAGTSITVNWSIVTAG
jgi:hypothetical protein